MERQNYMTKTAQYTPVTQRSKKKHWGRAAAFIAAGRRKERDGAEELPTRATYV
jgi:hypothetical protein